MAKNTRTMKMVLAGDAKQLNRTLDATASRTKKWGNQLRTAAKLGSAAAVGLSLALGKQAVSGALKLEKQLTEVRTLLPELTDKGFDAMRKSVIDLSNEMGIATGDVVPALYDAISAGVPPGNVFEFMDVAAKGAIGGVTDLNTSVDALTTVMNTWGKTAGVTARQAADVLFTSVRLGKTTFGELGSSINQVAGLASSFGIEFEEVAAAWTEVTKAGVPTTEAMTKIRALIQSVSAPTRRAAVHFEKLGIETGAARVANEGLLPVLQEIITATAGNEAQQRQLFGSVEALQAALVLTSGSGEGFTETLAEMEAATGAADKAFEAMADTTAFAVEAAQQEFNNKLAEAGTELLPVLIEALDLLNRVMPHVAAGLDIVVGKMADFADSVEGAVGAVKSFARRVEAGWGAVTRLFSSGADDAARSLGIVDEGARAMGQRVRAELALTSNSGITSFNNLADAARANAERIASAMRWSNSRMRSAQRAAVRDAAGYQVDLAEIDRLVEGSRWDLARETGAAAAKQLSDADRLLLGMRVAMRNACGEIDGFKQCVYGQVVQFDKDMGVMLTDAQRMQLGMAVEMTNACGTVTGFRQCVDGVQAEFDADMERILSDSERLAAGMAVPMVNACGEITGFRQCVDGLVVEFDAGMERILSDSERLAAGLTVNSRDACGALTKIQKCVDGVLVSIDAMNPGDDVRHVIPGLPSTTNPIIEDDVLQYIVETGYGPEGLHTYQTAQGTQINRLQNPIVPVELDPLDIIDYDPPSLADGGIVRARRGGTLVRVGEGGRDEAVVPLGSSGPAVSLDLRITVEGSVISEGDLGLYITERVSQALRRGEIDL